MTTMLGKQSIMSVKEASDIVKVVEEHGVSLKRAGISGYVGLCPFHEEHTPSFNVNPATKTYHCFGCGEGGDAINFVMEMDGLPFQEAVRALAEEFGADIPEESDDEEPGPSKKELLGYMQRAQDAFVASFASIPDTFPARMTISERGVSGMDDFGYAGVDAVRTIMSFPREILSLLGFLSARGNFLFTDRLTFPIRDVMGRVVAFSARKLDGDSQMKYVNTSASPLYNKSKAFYGLDVARKSKSRECFVVEGQMDVCSMRASGMDNAVASCGTAITQDHVDILLRRFDRIVFFLDGDNAGRKAAEKVLGLRGVALNANAVSNDSGKDPNEILVSEGPVKLKEMCSNQVPLIDMILSPLLPTGADPTEDARNESELLRIVEGIADVESRTAWTKFARSRFSELPDTHRLPERPVERASSEPDFVSLVSAFPDRVVRAANMDDDVRNVFMSGDLSDETMEILSGVLNDPDFSSHILEYVPSDERSHSSNPLWAFINSDKEMKALVLSLIR